MLSGKKVYYLIITKLYVSMNIRYNIRAFKRGLLILFLYISLMYLKAEFKLSTLALVAETTNNISKTLITLGNIFPIWFGMVTVTWTSDIAPVSSKEFPIIHGTVECGFTLKRARDMIRTYSQMHRTDKYSQRSTIIWPIWLNGLVFVYELCDCGFESRCSHLNFRYRVCFEKEVPWDSGNCRVWVHPETYTLHDKNIQSHSGVIDFRNSNLFKLLAHAAAINFPEPLFQ